VTDSAEVSIDAACAAANLVANNCAKEDLPLVVVFHGGGEPVLSWRLVDALQPELRRIAEAHRIPLFRYIATNGVMSAQRAHWLARSFDLVGLSIDGPSEIQLVQRPYRNSNRDSTLIILRTARILQEAGVPVHVRVTLTAESAFYQMEICRYLCQNISPSAISVAAGARMHPCKFGKHNWMVSSNPFLKRVLKRAATRLIGGFPGQGWQKYMGLIAIFFGRFCNWRLMILYLHVSRMVPSPKYMNMAWR
jgi:sulfatase maturation enzyme AslB (radical SAM superfamily)